MVGGSAKRGGKRTRRVRASDAAATELPSPRYAAINGLIPVRYRRMLQYLSQVTRVPQSVYLREAISDLLGKYRDQFDSSIWDDEPL